MKSKTLILIGLFAFGIGTWEVQAINPETISIINETKDIPTGYEIIELRGALMTNIAPNAIEAGANNEEVYIQFNQSFGNVSIMLYDSANNLIYQSIVNTNVQSIVIIPINSSVEGTFYLELNDATGGAEGDFEHNNN